MGEVKNAGPKGKGKGKDKGKGKSKDKSVAPPPAAQGSSSSSSEEEPPPSRVVKPERKEKEVIDTPAPKRIAIAKVHPGKPEPKTPQQAAIDAPQPEKKKRRHTP